MFNDTILRNIAFGDPEPDFDRVLWASQAANAHDFIMRLPLGYESRIGESGLGLSGGQKQQAAIASLGQIGPQTPAKAAKFIGESQNRGWNRRRR